MVSCRYSAIAILIFSVCFIFSSGPSYCFSCAIGSTFKEETITTQLNPHLIRDWRAVMVFGPSSFLLSCPCTHHFLSVHHPVARPQKISEPAAQEDSGSLNGLPKELLPRVAVLLHTVNLLALEATCKRSC